MSGLTFTLLPDQCLPPSPGKVREVMGEPLPPFGGGRQSEVIQGKDFAGWLMNSSDFKAQFDIAGVSIIPKMKSCGKENCGACPHGPFWYAQAPGYWTVARNNSGNGPRRVEVYLGRTWGSDDLLEKVAPLLALSRREPFMAWIAGQLDRERLAEIGELLKGVERDRAGERGALAMAERACATSLKELAQEESALKREAAALSKKLGLVNGGKTVIAGRRSLAPVKKKGAKRWPR